MLTNGVSSQAGRGFEEPLVFLGRWVQLALRCADRPTSLQPPRPDQRPPANRPPARPTRPLPPNPSPPSQKNRSYTDYSILPHWPRGGKEGDGLMVGRWSAAKDRLELLKTVPIVNPAFMK
jgi:hypothetical protein